MAEHFVVAVELENLNNGLDLKTISYLNRVYVAVGPQQYQQAAKFLEEYFDLFNIYLNCTALTNIEDLLFLLNSGATKVFVTYSQFKEIVTNNLLIGQDIGRLIVSSTIPEGVKSIEKNVEHIRSQLATLVPNVPIGIQFHDIQDPKIIDALHRISKDERFPVKYVPLAHNTRDRFAEAIKDGHVPIVPARELTTDPKQYSTLLPVHLLITAALQSDRLDGLFPTVVADERGICLGLVYSSEKSIETALQSGCGVYHSRRHGLWIKGQESGNTQELVKIAMDCDTDALQFTVRQKGKGNHLLLCKISALRLQ